MGQFLPDLGAGTQLTVAISQPNLITAVKTHLHTGQWAAKTTEGCLGGKDLLGQRVRGRQGSSQQGGPMKMLSPGDVCRAKSWMLPVPGSVSLPMVGTSRCDVCSLAKRSNLFCCYFCKHHPYGMWLHPLSAHTWVLKLKPSLFLVFRRFNEENLKLKLPLKKNLKYYFYRKLAVAEISQQCWSWSLWHCQPPDTCTAWSAAQHLFGEHPLTKRRTEKKMQGGGRVLLF